MLKRLHLLGHGHRAPAELDLALNLSFVLHERSDSKSVRSAVKACRAHAHALRRLRPELASPATTIDIDPTGVMLWLTATLGLPHLLAQALSASPEHVIAVDSGAPPLQPVQLFRANTQLSLPATNQIRVGVAALVLRPCRRTSHLAIGGAYTWPTDRDAVLRALERLIQANAGQWLPPLALWPGPAELLLPGEVH